MLSLLRLGLRDDKAEADDEDGDRKGPHGTRGDGLCVVGDLLEGGVLGVGPPAAEVIEGILVVGRVVGRASFGFRLGSPRSLIVGNPLGWLDVPWDMPLGCPGQLGGL